MSHTHRRPQSEERVRGRMADRPMLITRARAMRKQPSRAERAVWDIVRDRKLAAKFRRQHPIAGYIADFACLDAKLIVEVDGRSHDVAEQRSYDAVRTRALESAGWRVLSVSDTDALTDPAAVERTILNALRRRAPSPSFGRERVGVRVERKRQDRNR